MEANTTTTDANCPAMKFTAKKFANDAENEVCALQ